MFNTPKWLSILLGNCILIFLMQLVNNALGEFTVHLSLYGLFLYVPLLLVPFMTGLISVIVTGLILDASAMVPFGMITGIFTIVYTGCFWIYQCLKAYSNWNNMLLIQLSNAIVIGLLSVFINSSNYTSLYFWVSILMNLIFSQITLLFITSWFLTLHYSIFNFLIHKKEYSSKRKINLF